MLQLWAAGIPNPATLPTPPVVNLGRPAAVSPSSAPRHTDSRLSATRLAKLKFKTHIRPVTNVAFQTNIYMLCLHIPHYSF